MADSDHSSTPGNSPAFQFYPKDFLGDGDQAGMSLQETGAYARLMCFEWNAHGDGVPDDVVRCARMVGAQLGAMRKMWPTLRVLFTTHPSADGRLVHPRLEKERIKQALFRRRQSDASKKRWDTRGKAVASSRDIPNASSSVSSLQSSDSSQHPRKEREGVARTRTGSGVMAGSLPRDHLRHSWCGRVCVPDFLHGQFEQATGQSSETLKAFYADTFGAIPEDEAVDPDPPRFWRPRVVARWPPKLNGQSLNADGMGVEDLAAAIRDGREKGFYDRRG